MLPNEYHQLVAQQILGCDIERLDAAVREVTGHGLVTFVKSRLPKKSGGNLKFRNFNLMRFARKDFAEYIGKVPAHDGCPTQIYKIECGRTGGGRGEALVMRNGDYLFDIHAKSYRKVHSLAIAALHSYIADTRSRTNRRRAKKGVAE